MNEARAREILQDLVDGVDPFLQEELPQDTLLQHADVLRAMLAGIRALEAVVKRAKSRVNTPNGGRAWSSTEEQRLIEDFNVGEPIDEIAGRFGRTIGAIEARLEKLGLISPEERTTQNRFTQKPSAG